MVTTVEVLECLRRSRIFGRRYIRVADVAKHLAYCLDERYGSVYNTVMKIVIGGGVLKYKKTKNIGRGARGNTTWISLRDRIIEKLLDGDPYESSFYDTKIAKNAKERLLKFGKRKKLCDEKHNGRELTLPLLYLEKVKYEEELENSNN